MSDPKNLNLIAIAFAIISAVLWGCSARVNFHFGFDMDAELNDSMQKASLLNMFAAIFAALATSFQALAMYFTTT